MNGHSIYAQFIVYEVKIGGNNKITRVLTNDTETRNKALDYSDYSVSPESGAQEDRTSTQSDIKDPVYI